MVLSINVYRLLTQYQSTLTLDIVSSCQWILRLGEKLTSPDSWNTCKYPFSCARWLAHVSTPTEKGVCVAMHLLLQAMSKCRSTCNYVITLHVKHTL